MSVIITLSITLRLKPSANVQVFTEKTEKKSIKYYNV